MVQFARFCAKVPVDYHVLVLDVFLFDTSFFWKHSLTDVSPCIIIIDTGAVGNDVIHCLSLSVCQCLQSTNWPKTCYFHIAKWSLETGTSVLVSTVWTQATSRE